MITLVKTIRVRDDNTNREFSQDNIKQALIHVISYLLYNNTDNATLHLRTTYIDLAYEDLCWYSVEEETEGDNII